MAQISTSDIINKLTGMFPADKRSVVKNTVSEIVGLYEGQDVNAMGVLWRAVEKDRFDEYATKLKEYHASEGKNVPVVARSVVVGQNTVILETVLKREEEIAQGIRPATDRQYLPKEIQKLANYLGAIRMELFFLKCYRDLGVKPGEN